MNNREIFSARIKEVRLHTGKTQKEFANMVSSTAATISAYENGSKNPSLEIVKNIAEKCNISIDWLCGLSEQKKNNNIPETYADVIDLLVKAEQSVHFHVGKQKITVNDSVLQYFLDDWGKMLPLLHNGTIDNKLYKLWLNDKKKEYENIHMGNKTEIEEFLTVMDAIGSSILSMPKQPSPPQ